MVVSFLEEVGSDLAGDAAALPLVELGRQTHVVGGTAEAPFPLNVGLMFFHPEPHRFFPGTQIDVVWFPEGPGGDRFTEKEFRGPLHMMLREALDYIQRNYLSETVIKHADRPESTRVANFPLVAIEESLVNAVYHRSYELREPIEVRIGRDELSVVSYPGPDRSVKLEQLRVGRGLSRRYRNRRIGELLKELDLTEGRGTGIPKILGAMRANGSPAPIFEFDDDRSYFAVILPVHPHAAEATPQVAPPVTPPVAVDMGRLLGAVSGDRSAQELRDALGLSDRKHFRSTWLGPALASGLIEMTIPDKPNSRLQRYRLTAAGRASLAAHRASKE